MGLSYKNIENIFKKNLHEEFTMTFSKISLQF